MNISESYAKAPVCQALPKVNWGEWCNNRATYGVAVTYIKPTKLLNVGLGIVSWDERSFWLYVCKDHVKKHLVEKAKFRLTGIKSGYSSYRVEPIKLKLGDPV